MAITLSARTDAILDSVLRALNADSARLAEAPLNAQVVGVLRANTTATTTTLVRVSNGHLWPQTGQVTIVDGASTETLDYVQVLPVGRTGNKRPTYSGVGNPPEALLRLSPGTTTASNHTAPRPVHAPTGNAGMPARQMDSGLLGVHDLAALFRALKRDLTPAVLTVSGAGAANGTTVADTGAFTASAHIGDTVTMVTGAGVAGQTRTIASNTTDALMVSPAFSAQVPTGATYQINIANYDTFLSTLESKMPGAFNSANARTIAAGDTSPTPGELATTMAALCVHVIARYGGTVPANNATTAQLAREEDRTTRLAAAAATADTVITVVDASRLLGYTNILVGSTAAIIQTNRAKRGGQGPNTVLLTAALGGAGEAVGAVVGPDPRGTVALGRRHIAAAPHGVGRGLETYVLEAISAIEDFTLAS